MCGVGLGVPEDKVSPLPSVATDILKRSYWALTVAEITTGLFRYAQFCAGWFI